MIHGNRRQGTVYLRSVAAGTYRLLAQQEAFVRAAGRTVTIAPGQSMRDLVVAMTPTGVITGRVVDEYGDPVPDVYVRAALKAGNFIPFTALRGESHATVYYPGTTDAAAAAPVEVPAGAEVGAINFTTAVRSAGP